ncbi:hypothetical protein D9M69_445050 [compost metagenome]
MANHTDVVAAIDGYLASVDLDASLREGIKKIVRANLAEAATTAHIKDRLGILFEYEKNYLSLIKEFKEEIKFVGALQEDLRKERAKFFSDTLKDVSETLKDSQVASDVASKWIQELVSSYTKSLDFSSGLVEENTFDMVGQIRKFAKESVDKAGRPQSNEIA